jgi:NAD(P)-dependent dehydrogenase (short-subunit alcohol dehydrogenase family)
MKTKICMTGHTKGIGAAIYNSLENDFDVIGFSRTNGYNILKPGRMRKIVEESKDCDIFINNAYAPDSQNRLLHMFYKEWEFMPKHIINIGATSPDYPQYFGKDGFDEWMPYVSDKARLDYQSTNLSNRWKRGNCKVTNLRPHFVDTKAIDVHNRDSDEILTPLDVAYMVRWIIDQPVSMQIRRLDFCTGV